MADGSDRTPGTGEKVATDEASYSGDTMKFQLVRPVGIIGAEGSRTVVDPTFHNNFRVAVTSAGLTTATTAYSAGDQVGTQFTVANAAHVSGGSGRIRGIFLHDLQDIIASYDALIFRASGTPASDNAACSISTTDILNLIAVVPLTPIEIGATRICQAYNLDIPYDCSGGTSLYVWLMTRAGHTFFTGGVDRLRLIMALERNIT